MLAQSLLSDLKLSVVESMYLIGPTSVAFLMSAVVTMEARGILADGGLAVVAENPAIFATAALLGTLVNFLAFFVIQTTSSLMLKVLATARSAALVLVRVAPQAFVLACSVPRRRWRGL